MLKKVIFSFFFCWMLLVNSTVLVLAQEEEENLSSATATLTPTPSEEYQLPYPGLLPDNPFYPLKTLRDKIIGFLIADPLKKAEFDILQADKRLNVGVYLMHKKGKEKLVESTISKGENYFADAIQQIKEAQRQRLETKDIIRKLALSTKKHQEVLAQIRRDVPENLKKQFTQLITRAAGFEKQAQALHKEK